MGVATRVAEAARARERFLSRNGRPPTTSVRPTIEASWLRSHRFRVDAENPEPSHVDIGDPDTVLARAARRILDSLEEELANEPVCIILTNARGVVLDRRGGDRSLHRKLDAAMLAPGFSYAEASVGTNGIGTALEIGAPTLVEGGEHYAGNLGVFACAGAPVKHPTTGALLGVLDITSLVQSSNSLLLAFAKVAAARIQDEIRGAANAVEQALLNDYYTACRHTGGPVIALGGNVLMINDQAQRTFSGVDQASLLGQIRESLGTRSETTFLTDLPSGVTARLNYRPTFCADRLAGGVFRIQSVAPVGPTVPAPRSPRMLRGMAGSSATWQRAVQEVLSCARLREWAVLEGEPGTGKLTLARAVHDETHAGRRLTVVDATRLDGPAFLEAIESALDLDPVVLVQHAERLEDEVVTELSALLQTVHDRDAQDKPWVLATTAAGHGNAALAAELLPFFPRTVTVPPLRHHLEDVPELTRHLFGRLGRPELTLDPAAQSQLMRMHWPGNVEHLKQVLSTVARTRRSGVVPLDDLPPECRATTRRRLTQVESLERDAIVEALVAHGGDKAKAAAAIGMSRATIYRKIHNYGIVA